VFASIELETRIKGESPEVDELIGMADTVRNGWFSAGEDVVKKAVSSIVVERVEEGWLVLGTRLSKFISRLFDEQNTQHL